MVKLVFRKPNSDLPIGAFLSLLILCAVALGLSGCLRQPDPQMDEAPAFEAPAFEAPAPLPVQKAETNYTINGEITTLTEISLFLYGVTHRAALIAEWNGLAPPYPIRIGQKLKLRIPPRLTPEEGRAAVLEMWRENLMNRMEQQEHSGGHWSYQRAMEHYSDENWRVSKRYFRTARTEDPENVSAWLHELKTLKNLKMNAELSETLRLFVKAHPQLGSLPAIENYRKLSGSTHKRNPAATEPATE